MAPCSGAGMPLFVATGRPAICQAEIVQMFVNGSTTRVVGELSVPASKYHAHRALVLASLAPGRSVIHGLSETRQMAWTIGSLRALGTRIDIDVERGCYVVDGRGGEYSTRDDVTDHGSSSSDGVLDVGSSGTTLYFLTGLASLADRPITLTGMKYFRRRPIKALLDALGTLGVRYESHDDRPPVTVQPGRPEGGHVQIRGTLSQWISGLLLLAPFARRPTTIEIVGELNEQPYVELTVRMMRHFGLDVEVSADWRRFVVAPNQTARATDYTLPPDLGSAAFGLAATAVHPSDVLFRGLRASTAADADHPEAELLDLLGAMGVPMHRDVATGFVRVEHGGIRLSPIDVDCRPIPDLLPVVAALTCFAPGVSRLHDIAHVRLKESDRVQAMLQLNKLGGSLVDSGDALTVTGVDSLRGAAMSSFNDHRVLMSLAIAATRAGGSSQLTYPHAYRISYPGFVRDMAGIGLDVTIPAAVRARRGAADGAGAGASEDGTVPA